MAQPPRRTSLALVAALGATALAGPVAATAWPSACTPSRTASTAERGRPPPDRRQTEVRWNFWNDRDGVGPRWPW